MNEQATHRKVALVTGANKGIGRGAAEQLAELGMTVLIGARTRGAARRPPRRCARGRRRARDRPGRHRLGHRPGGRAVDRGALRPPRRPDQQRRITGSGQVSHEDAHDQVPSTVDLDMVRAVFETNVFGVIAVTNAMLPLLRRSPAPRVVNVSSHAASMTLLSDPEGPMSALLPSAAYSPSKSALNALTVQYANELRKDGVLVNAAAPGFVATDSNDHTGFLTVAQGAAVLVRLATLGADGPTAGYFSEEGPLPW